MESGKLSGIIADGQYEDFQTFKKEKVFGSSNHMESFLMDDSNLQQLKKRNSVSEPEVKERSCLNSQTSIDTEFEDKCANSSGGPCIISVPVSEAVTHEIRPSVQSSAPRLIIQLPSQEMPREHPQRLVIRVKKVYLGKKSSSRRSSPQFLSSASPPTLKEDLESDEADYFTRKMMISPQVNDCSTDSSSVGDDDCLSSFSPASSIRSADGLQPEKAKGIEGNAYRSTEKKLRKKEHDKRAALRYRRKKKEEERRVLAELRREEEYREKLLLRYEIVRKELTLIKQLFREMLVAQGKLVE